MKKNIVILGSNNSLGVQAINFFKKNLNKYFIYGISYDNNVDNINLFINQIKELKPKKIFLTQQNDAEHIKAKIDVEIIQGFDNFTNFISNKKIDEVISSLSGIFSVKYILSSIYEYKDITLLNTSPLLYNGKIIINEIKSKGIDLKIFSYPLYSLDFINKSLNKRLIDEIQLFSVMKKNQELTFTDFKTTDEYFKYFFSVNKIRLVIDMFLLHYMYDFPANKFSFMNQSKKLMNANIKYQNGTNIYFAAKLNLTSIFNYYYLGKNNVQEKNLEETKINVNFTKITPNSEKYLDLGIKALEKGGSMIFVYYYSITYLLNEFVNKKIKEKVIYEITKNLIEDKTLYHKYPDLSTISAIENSIVKKINSFIKK